MRREFIGWLGGAAAWPVGAGAAAGVLPSVGVLLPYTLNAILALRPIGCRSNSAFRSSVGSKVAISVSNIAQPAKMPKAFVLGHGGTRLALLIWTCPPPAPPVDPRLVPSSNESFPCARTESRKSGA